MYPQCCTLATYVGSNVGSQLHPCVQVRLLLGFDERELDTRTPSCSIANQSQATTADFDLAALVDEDQARRVDPPAIPIHAIAQKINGLVHGMTNHKDINGTPSA